MVVPSQIVEGETRTYLNVTCFSFPQDMSTTPQPRWTETRECSLHNFHMQPLSDCKEASGEKIGTSRTHWNNSGPSVLAAQRSN
jgi:hypothetical protein